MSPFTMLHEGKDFVGSVEAIARYQDDLYVGTSQSLYHMEPAAQPGGLPNFVKFPNIISHIWSLASTSDGLIVGAGNGIYVVRNGIATLIQALDGNAAYHLYPSRLDPKVVYVGHTYNLALLVNEDGAWRYKGPYQGFNESIRSIVEDEAGNLWLGTDVHGTLFVQRPDQEIPAETTPAITRYGADHGLPEGIVMPMVIDGEVRFATAEGMRRLNPDTQMFEGDTSLGEAFESVQVYRYSEDEQGQFWIKSGGYHTGEVGVVTANGNTRTWQTTPFSRFANELGVLRAIHTDKKYINGMVWRRHWPRGF